MPRTVLPVLAVLSMATAACAPVAGGSGSDPTSSSAATRQCFSQDRIINFRQAQDQSIYMRVQNRDVFQLQSSGCDLAYSNTIQIGTDSGASRVCTGDTVRIRSDGNALSNNLCRARITRILTEAEVDALPTRDQP